MSENIIESLSRTCDPNLNNEERRNCFMILNHYQNEQFQLSDLKTLLSPCLDQQVNVWGLKCLEHFILYKWNVADKDSAKTYLIEIIKEYNNFNTDTQCERVMRWIISKSVMYFIRHECPQNCSTIISDLINLQTNGVKSQALILSIFYCLSEFLPVDTQMPDKRKKEVVGYLTDNFSIIVQFCLDIIQINSNFPSNFLNLQSEAINAIQSFSTWIKFENRSSIIDQIFTVLTMSLKVTNTDFSIFEVFEVILDRKCRPEERYSTFSILISNRANFHQLLSCIRQGLNLEINPYSDEKFRYLQKQIDLLLVMGNAIVNNWSKFSKDVTDDSFDKFMDLIQLATHHPVKILSIELLSFWYNGFKIDNENLRMILVSKAGSLLSLLKFYSIKPTVRNPANVDHEYLVHLIEPQDEEAYVNRIRFETSKTISTLTEYFSRDIVDLCLDMVSSIMIAIHQIEDNCSSMDQLTSMDSDIMKQFEASRYFTRCVMHNIFRPYSKNLQDQVTNIAILFSNETIVKGENIISSILTAKNPTIHIIDIYIELIHLLLPFVSNNDHIIQACLEKIFVWFSTVESVDPQHSDYGLWRQLNKTCGVWLLRIFRDYNFLISSSLFESILSYYQTICNKLYEHPIIVEAMTIYICHSSSYTVSQQEAILSRFIDPIKQVLLSETCGVVFENGCSIINYLHMDRHAPGNDAGLDYPSQNHQQFRHGIIQATNCLYGICSRLSSNDTDNNTANTEFPEALSINTCPLKDYIVPLLPSLLKIIRALNMMWNSNALHSDFSSLKEISVFYRDTLIKNNTVEKIHPNNAQTFAQLYINNCRNFVCRLHECIWLTLAKYCSNFSEYLYNLKEWHTSITEYVFADLDSLPNFKLTPMIKSFVIPFISNCPAERRNDVIPSTIIPFVNYMFGRLSDKWANIKTVQFNDDLDLDNEFQEVGVDGNEELCNEIIEEQVLRATSKIFCDLFKITMATVLASSDASTKVIKLPLIADRLYDPNLNGNCPTMLVILSNLCHSITWKDSFCCSRLIQLIYPIVNEIHSRGFLNIDITLFIFQQLICALNLFAINFPELKITLLNLAVNLYDEHIAKDNHSLKKFFTLLDKSSNDSIQSFQNKMNAKASLKLKRGNLQALLQPYVAVPTNQLFSQEVYIKDLPPLMKAHWKNKGEHQSHIDSEEPLCLEDLFKY